MKFGYARVSTVEQNLNLQIDALSTAGCERIFEEKISSRKSERPIWSNLITLLRPGDVIVVYKLDRIARSTRELLETVDHFKELEVSIISLQEPWANTTNASGKMIMTIMAGIAEFERDLIKQRAQDGRDAAMRRGVHMGRPAKLNSDQIDIVVAARNDGRSVKALANSFGVSPDTIYRALAKHADRA